MTASTQPLQQKAAALLHDYLQIATRSDLDQALMGLSAVTVCGNLSQSERKGLQRMIDAAGEGHSRRPVFVTSPSLSAPRETLLYPAHLSEHQLNHLLRQLYNTDALICGVLLPSILTE